MLLILAGWLAFGPTAPAGIYSSRDPIISLPMDHQRFRDLIGGLRLCRKTDGEPTPATFLRERYRLQLRQLEEKQRDGAISLRDRIDLSVCYLRLGRALDARRVLEEIERSLPAKEPAAFLLYGQLALVYHDLAEQQADLGYLDQAIAYQRKALALWPEVWFEWTFGLGMSFRRSEQFYLRLLQSRRDELRQRPDWRDFRTVDPLFPKVKFVGPSGEYEPGRITNESFDELPIDAIVLVQQLALWRPFDDRLYWLYGELLNAKNEVARAHDVLAELVDGRQLGKVRELNRHRQILVVVTDAPLLWAQMLCLGMPRSGLTVPVVGYAASEAIWWVYPQIGSPDSQKVEVEAQGPQDGTGRNPPAAAPAALPGWRSLFVGFILGGVVSLLVSYQWREWRRKAASAILERRFGGE
jgi:hypothetical protein